MAKKKKKAKPGEQPAATNELTQDTAEIQPEPAGAESTPDADAGPSGESGDAGIQPRAGMDPVPFKLWTMDELMAEYFPGAKSVSGGVLGGLQRELRRRNRMAEKGY